MKRCENSTAREPRVQDHAVVPPSASQVTASQKRSAKEAFAVFRHDPFDPRLRTHKIHRLSSPYGKTIFSVWVESDLRAVFYVEGNIVVSVDIGSHEIYRS